MQNKTRDFLKRAALAVLPVTIVALISSFFTRTGDYWYQTLAKPAFTPPQWVFPVAWGIVYVCLMAALYLLLRLKNFDHTRLLLPCIAIGVLNIAWSLLFFGLHMMLPALISLFVLLAVLVILLRAAYPLCKAVSWLLLPHILWGAFAFVLNIGFLLLNRG